MGKVALPFLQMPVTAQIPLKTMQLEENAPIGQHIRKRRIDLKLLQRQVADLVGVTEDCMTNWENGRAIPQIQYMPKLIDFLGYNPMKVEDETLGGRIKNYRISHGLSHKKLGELVGVNASTICAWEHGTSPPTGANLKAMERILHGDP